MTVQTLLLPELLLVVIHNSNNLFAVTGSTTGYIAQFPPLTFRASWSIITLCGLISRCMMPWLWQYSSACKQLLHAAHSAQQTTTTNTAAHC